MVYKQEKMKRKGFWIAIIIILALGIFIRLENPENTTFTGDTKAVIPEGLLWYYPHDIFPGIASQGEPPLGHMVIGAGCLLSGEDFSEVSKIKPMFYPGREGLIGPQVARAEEYCYIPIFAFGILLLITLSIIATALLNEVGALIATTFFAFQPFILQFSRLIMHVDVILWTWLALATLFLLKGYLEEKGTKKEKIYFIIAAIFLGLGGATKLSFGAYLLFFALILLDKYWREIKNVISRVLKLKGDWKISKKEVKFIALLIFMVILFTLAFLLPFQLKPQNVIDVYNTYTSHSQDEGGLGFNLGIHKFIINQFLYEVNIFDALLFFLAIPTLYWLLKKKDKDKKEKFVLYFLLTTITTFIFTNVFHFTRIAIPYLFPIVFLMAMVFSDKEYGILTRLKIKNKGVVGTILLIIYLAFSFWTAFSAAPFFETRNPIFCKVSNFGCDINLYTYTAKTTGNYLKEKLNDNETFMLQEGPIFWYVIPEQSLANFQFDQAFRSQTGREPTLIEKINLFRPENRTVRYLLVNPKKVERFEKEINQILEQLEPNYKIVLNGQEVLFIYDLQNLNVK